MLMRLKVYHLLLQLIKKTTSNNPRSTVGTVTEIYDYLRLLYARVGKAYCPKHDVVIESQTIKQMADTIDQYADGDRLMVVARVVKERKELLKIILRTY